MARTNPQTRLQALHREARKQQQQIKRIQNSRKFSVRRLTKSNLQSNGPSGIQGGIAADEDNCLWVQIDGVWQELICGGGGIVAPVTNGNVLMAGYFDKDESWGTDLFVADPIAGTVVPITNVGIPESGSAQYDGMIWWDGTKQEILSGYEPPDGTDPIYSRYHRMNADGSGATEIFMPEITGVDSQQPFETSMGAHMLSYYIGGAGFGGNFGGQLHTYNFDTEEEVGMFWGSDLPVASGQLIYGSYFLPSPDASKIIVVSNNYPTTPTIYKIYVVNIVDGGNPHLLFDTGVGDGLNTNWDWHPSSAKILVTGQGSVTGTGVIVINPDGTGEELAYDGLVSTKARWSPDGTKFAHNYHYDLRIRDATTYEELAHWDADFGIENWDWSPLGDKIIGVQGIDNDLIYVWDIESGEQTLIFDGPSDSTNNHGFFFSTVWGRKYYY